MPAAMWSPARGACGCGFPQERGFATRAQRQTGLPPAPFARGSQRHCSFSGSLQRLPVGWGGTTIAAARRLAPGCRAGSDRTDVFAFGLDGVVCDTAEETTAIAFRVAKDMWPESVVGESYGLYAPKMREVWPAIEEAAEAVLMIRMLSEEGAIGGRSTASNRAGPVAQPAGARSPHGTRPLQSGEIRENWEDLRETCKLRWGLGEDIGAIRDLFAKGREAWAAEDRQSWLSAIQPHPPIVAALQECPGPVYIWSAWEGNLLEAVLSHCGIDSSKFVVLEGEQLSEVLEGAGEGGRRVHVVKGRLSDLKSIESLAAGTENAPTLRLCLSDWGFSTPSIKARAVLSPSVEVITDSRLAELMGVADSNVVMDGVAW